MFDDSCDPVSVYALSTNCLLSSFQSHLRDWTNVLIGLIHIVENGVWISIWPKQKSSFPTKVATKSPNLNFIYNATQLRLSSSTVQWYCHSGVFFLVWHFHTSNQSPAHQSIKLFDVFVLPVLAYAIEIWGLSLLNNEKESQDYSLKCLLESPSCENLNVKICKYILGISRKSSNDAARDKLGRHPILLLTMPRWINYMIHYFSLPVQNFAHDYLNPVDDIAVDSTVWLSKMINVISLPSRAMMSSSVLMPYSTQLLHALYRSIICLDTNQHG